MDKEKFLKRLSNLYDQKQSTVLAIITGNKSYLMVTDQRVKEMFPDLKVLYTGRCEHREQTWWARRWEIYGLLLREQLITLPEFKDAIKYF